ncbi:HPP family protein [Pseudoroseomonas oryzae]|uniref:HPP family protein n=2 Tax=Teichococcus oryzae TaxID=1608942 RepID=A0A5B2TDV5_9PROT|nr:HPP family protein [Pseudoroseomonas oryzae]
MRAPVWLRGFWPTPMTVSITERLRGCLGAVSGLLLTGLASAAINGNWSTPSMLIAPLGASAVLLFAVPASPLAQPWSIVGGNTVSALIGVTCAQLIGDPLFAAPLAVSLAIGAMFALRCLHPPGGAIALTAVLGGPAVTSAGYEFVLLPVGLGSLLLMATALVFNNATRRPYPHSHQARPSHSHLTTDGKPTERLGVSAEDLDAALRQHDEFLDISRDDLGELVQEAEMRAYRRRFGQITCADIMSRDVVTARPDMPLREAWALLRRHDIRALPVIDADQRVTGMISEADLLAVVENGKLEGREAWFLRLVRPGKFSAGPPRVVGQVMPRGIPTVTEGMHAVELVPLMADKGLRHVVVVDQQQRLAGIISQADLIAALYRGRLEEQGAGAGRQAA